MRISPQARHAAAAAALPAELPPQEIGVALVSEAQLQQVKARIEEAPPVSFDLARQVRVFQPYLQYVDVELTGAAIEKRTVTIPPAIQNLGLGRDLEGRMRTTFALLAKDDKLSSKSLTSELDALRKSLTRSLPKFGRVILKNARPRFDQRIVELKAKVSEHGQRVGKNLAAALAVSRKEILEYYLPIVEKKPPDELYNSLLSGKPGTKEVRAWLEKQLDRVFPSAEELVGQMELFVDYKDVTFETLNHPEFFAQLKKAYPDIPWDRPFSDFKAAGEKEPTKSD